MLGKHFLYRDTETLIEMPSFAQSAGIFYWDGSIACAIFSFVRIPMILFVSSVRYAFRRAPIIRSRLPWT